MKISMNAVQAIIAGAVAGMATWVGLTYVVVAAVSS